MPPVNIFQGGPFGIISPTVGTGELNAGVSGRKGRMRIIETLTVRHKAIEYLIQW